MLKKVWERIKSWFIRVKTVRYKAPANDGQLWTQEEIEFMMCRNNWSHKRMGKYLKRTPAAIRQKRYYERNGIVQTPRKRK